ncbi:MAG: hypothetical protein GDA51_00615 [Ekhidna sp.]|nr:hypothetical protein [Ekhidna sp.]
MAFLFISLSHISFAQTEKGHILLEVGTSSFGEPAVKQGASTGMNLWISDGTTLFSIGAEGGYFIKDNLALKVGLGYTENRNNVEVEVTNFFTYKVGVKNYFKGVIPLQADFTGAVNIDGSFGEVSSPLSTSSPALWLGLQGGYAFFLKENIAFEPAIRYNIDLGESGTEFEDFFEGTIFELKFNFSIFF